MSMSLKDDILKAIENSKRITEAEVGRKILKYKYFSNIDKMLVFINYAHKLKKEDIQQITRIPRTYYDDSYELFYWEEE